MKGTSNLTFLGTGPSTGVPFIGCSCAVCMSKDPRDKRLRTSALVTINGQNIVIDSGPDFREQMLCANVQEIKAILLTHEHRDHIAGLDDIRPYMVWQEDNLPIIYANELVQTAVRKAFYYVFEAEKYPGAPTFNFHTIDLQPFKIDGTQIIPIEVIHGELPVLGFRFITQNGDDFTYITDAKYISEVEKEKIKGTKVLVLNALRQDEHWSHLSLPQAIALVQELEIEQAYFTHISHKMGLHADVSELLAPNIQLAYDGLEIVMDS